MAHAYNSVPVNMYQGFASLTADEQRVEFMFRTSPHRATEGLFRLPMGYIEEDIGMDRETARVAIEGVVSKRQFRYDFDAGVVLDLQALRNSPIRNGVNKAGDVVKDKRMQGAIARLRALPPTSLLLSLYEVAAVDSPDFAQEMSEHFQGIDLGAPLEAPSDGSMDGPYEAPSQAPPEGGWHGASRAEKSRDASRRGRAETRSETEPIELLKSELNAEDVTDDPGSLHHIAELERVNQEW